MAFNQYDLYLASGTGQLINSWTDPVYKFDSSSFYNWEQDNLPLYDLEERDDYLHEMAGYPGVIVSSIMLTVSDCGVDNKKIFSTLSGAIGALPNTIRQPIIIEVCVSGQLGDLRLENKQFAASGSGIEIINRGFAKVLAGSGAMAMASVSSTENGAADGSSIIIMSSIDTSNTMANTFCVGLSGVPIDSKLENPGPFWNNFTRSFMLPPEWSNTGTTSTKTVTISSKFADTGSGLMDTNVNGFNVAPYADNSASSDIQIMNKWQGADIQRPDIDYIEGQTRTTGFIYANVLNNVTINNCAGNIFIRGFCVDGGNKADLTDSAAVQRTKIGFDIQNSEVVLENCTATRCKDAGIAAYNSNVILNRGFIAYHNYELEDQGANYLNLKTASNKTPGLRALNSNITLSSAVTAAYGCPLDSPFAFSRNMVGIDLENSEIITPPKYGYGRDTAGIRNSNGTSNGIDTLVLQTFFNVEEGIKAKQSLLNLGGRLSSFQNNVGVKLENSTCRVSEVSIDHNQEAGLDSDGSIFNYNKNGELIARLGPFNPITNFFQNGQHVTMKESEFIPTYVSGMDTKYTQLLFSGNHSVQNYGGERTTVPSVSVENGSYMNAVCPNAVGLVSIDDSAKAVVNAPVKGGAFYVNNNSTLDLNGTQNFVTKIIGPVLWSKQQHTTGLYAGQNSTINIAGPTSIVQYGVDALAEDNSTIQIGPHQKNGLIDVSGWSLLDTPNNHTMVQLHATRACLVANRNSTINMHDLGDYHQNWDPKYYGINIGLDYPTGDAVERVGGDFYGTSGFCYNGSLQFYPNPFVLYTDYDFVSQSTYPTAQADIQGIATWTALPLKDDAGAGDDVSSASYGGMCVRAVGGSNVVAKNVTFPAGWGNPSGPYYDLETEGACDLLKIWNIADDSKLHASYLTVGNAVAYGGTIGHPQDLSGYYYGPSALWTSDSGTGLSGAPSSTADTSTLSILDSFGLGVETKGELGYYGKTAQENIGPFRIYISPHPKAKFLGSPRTADGAFNPMGGVWNSNPPYSMGFSFPDSATLETGGPYQIFAQGYSTSSDCSATNNQGPNYTNVSAVYQDLGFSGYITSLPVAQQATNTASSFYYTSAMVGDTVNNIWLDESAMNTFANAKNGTLNTSGRKPIFNYYQSTTVYPGEGFATGSKAKGLGSANLFDLERDL